jgi:hypothetical protein
MDAPVQPNWVADINRWNLPAPPVWFLKRLYDFDPMLVIVPSRKQVLGERPGYLLCRRRLHSAGIGDVAMLDNKHPDTNMCYGLGVLPIGPLRFKTGVTTFTQGGLNSLIADLKSRDIWAITGGPGGDEDAGWKAVEYAEELEKRKERASLKEKFYQLGRDAYRSIKARSGQRSKRASDYHGVARPKTT